MRAHRHGEGEAGQAIVELAFAVPVLLVVMLVGLWGIGLARESIVLADAARDAARAIARGQQEPPRDAGIAMTRLVDGDQVTVLLRRQVRTPLLGGIAITLEQQATSLREGP